MLRKAYARPTSHRTDRWTAYLGVGPTILVGMLVLVLTSCTLQFPFQHTVTNGHLASKNSPYGFTVLQFRQQTVADLKELGVTWVRYQLDWSKIESQPNHFDWSTLDAVVILANANGIYITFPIQNAPQWALSQTCQGNPLLPNPDTFAQFAGTVAYRYNGKHGHGYIDSYEVGNEEFDSIWVGTWEKSIPCRQPNFYAPLLKEAYQAIKAQSPNALVGMFGMLWANTDHIRSFMQGLYDRGDAAFFDFANFHYYRCGDGGSDPSTTTPGYPTGKYPSFDLEWHIIHEVMARNGQPGKPIWVTETGWPTHGIYQDPKCVITPQVQSQYLQYVLSEAKNSHTIQRLFWYTIDKVDGMSITQPNKSDNKLPSFYTMRTFVLQNPTWH